MADYEQLEKPEALAQAPSPPPQEPAAIPPDDKKYLKQRARKLASEWVKETASGIVSAVTVVLVGMVLVQFGLASEGQQLSFKLFEPYEFWKSFSGLVVQWSQWNEWLLLGLGLVALAATVLVILRWRRSNKARRQAEEASEQDHQQTETASSLRKPLLQRAEDALHSMRLVGALALMASLFIGGYVYQQYLWNIELPVPKGQIGIAFTRQIGSSAAEEKLADYLRQMGHEGQIAMRELPVTFDARDTAKAQQFARRIGAAAVVIYREEDASVVQDRGPGLAAPAAQDAGQGKHYVVYIVFADPSLGVEIPVPQSSPQGEVQSVSYRTKEGVEVPRLEAGDLSRLMEAAAGILLYDQDRYLPAIAHLKDALEGSGQAGASDGLLHFYLGSAYYLVHQDGDAKGEFDEAIKTLEGEKPLSVQDRLLLAETYSFRSEYYIFDDNKYDEGEALLKKAVALREPLDKDESALADPVTFRRAHDVFGTAYIRLMELASLRKDQDAVALWTERARDEAKALMSNPEDNRARVRAIWITFLTGDCRQAYKMAYDLLQKNPDDLYGHRLIWRIAALRDGNLNGVETKEQLDALLKINPNSLPDLQTLLLYYNLRLIDDQGYMDNLKATAGSILEIDPSNVQALETYVSQVAVYTGSELTLDLSVFGGQAGHGPTYVKQQAQWNRDNGYIRKLLAKLDAARPYVTRWSEEVQPDSARPVLFATRLSRRAESLIYNYALNSFLTDKTGANTDKALVGSYEAAADRAIKDGTAALDPKRHPAPLEAARAHTVISEVWYDRTFLKSIQEGAGSVPDTGGITQAVEHAQEAARLVEANPPSAIEDSDLVVTVYGDLTLAALSAKQYYEKQNNATFSAQYNSLYKSSFAHWQQVSTTTLPLLQAQAKSPEAFATCSGGQELNLASQALVRGDYAGAVDLLKQYIQSYPNDPVGAATLGWAQYLDGDLANGLANTERFEQLAPDNAYAPERRAVILLAQGKADDARHAISAMFEKMQSRPLGIRLEVLNALGEDLTGLAKIKTEARDGIRAALPDVKKYAEGLPPEARNELGAKLSLALNNLGSAAIWAGDYELAKGFLKSGLELNGDYVLMRANLGFAELASGDESGAQAEYSKAIRSTASYLKNPDGTPLDTEAKASAIAQAKQELQSASTDLEMLTSRKPELEGPGKAIDAALQSAESSIK